MLRYFQFMPFCIPIWVFPENPKLAMIELAVVIVWAAILEICSRLEITVKLKKAEKKDCYSDDYTDLPTGEQMLRRNRR